MSGYPIELEAKSRFVKFDVFMERNHYWQRWELSTYPILLAAVNIANVTFNYVFGSGFTNAGCHNLLMGYNSLGV
jgi:hypothetical protein